MEFYANLHTHSTHSDGQFTPSQLAQVAKEEGYRALALTDHDTVTGYGELKAECDKLGLECIFGIYRPFFPAAPPRKVRRAISHDRLPL